MADILHGNASANQLNATTDRTQVYGLAGNDTLTSDGKSDVLLVGGSGNDSLVISGGNGTLSGGAGADTFELNYSATQTLSAVIEDVDPSNDKIVVNFDGTATPTLNSVASGSYVVLSDSDGLFNVTLKGIRENDYFDGTQSDAAWEVLSLTNDERENQSLSPLTMSDGLTAGASVRVNEIFNNGSGSSYISHTRPNGSEWYTALTKNYSASGENLDAGGNLSLPSAAVAAWIGSASHYANIVNPSYQKLGVGYIYEDSSDYEHYWVQLFGSTLTTPETVSTSNLLTTPVEVNNVSKVIQLANGGATYSNTVEGATIIGGTGNDSITNSGPGLGGRDTPQGNYVLINGNEGNDTINNVGYYGGSYVTMNGGAGKDYIYNINPNVTIDGGADDDTIDNYGGSDSSVVGGAGNDSIYNDGSFGNSSNATLEGGAGNDYIHNQGADAVIFSGEGDDSINNTINEYGPSDSGVISIDGGTGDDYIWNQELVLYSTVTFTRDALIIGGDGNDTIENYSSNATISGGKGNDHVFGYGTNVLINYASGDGNDTVAGFNTTSTLQIGNGSGTYSTQTSGSDVIVSVGTGSILLQGAASLGSSLNIAGTDSTDTTPANPLLITLTEGDDTYSNSVAGATIAALGGNDSIANGGYNSTLGSNVSISGAAGNDTIFNWSGDNSTVYGGTGDDSIFNNANSVIIDGGAGNDSLWNSQYEWSAVASATILGGAGNDAVWNYSDSVTVDGGAGNDSLWSTNNFISLSGGAGSDSIYNDGGDNDTINGGTGNDYIRLITSLASAQNNLIQYAAGDGNDTINGFNSTSTLQIGGGTGTYSTQQSGSDIIVSVGDGSIRLLDAASLSAINIAGEEVATVDPLNIVGTEGADNISNTLAGATIAALGGNDTVDNTGARVSISGGADNDSIKNSGVRSTLLGDAGADRIENSGVLSTIFGGRGNDEISLSSGAANSYIQYEPGDGNDTIWGNDTNTTLRIMSDNARPINTGDDIVYYIGEGSIRLIGARIRPPQVVLGASGTSGGGSGSGGSGGSSSSGSSGSGSSGSGSSGSSGGSGGSSGSSSGGSGGGGTSGTSSSRPPVSSSSSRTSSGTSNSVGYVSTNRKDSIASAAARRLYNEMTATNQPTQQTTAATTQNVYTGGNQVISNYQSGDKIIFGTDYTGAFYDAAGNFFAGSSTGALAVENAMDKVIDLRDAAGNDFVKAYAATTAGVIDGRGIAGFELINGSAGADAIYAGDGGSQMWGGSDVATDILVGGGGADIFIGGRTQGADLIVNASSADTVHLNDATLNDIIATEENNGVVAVAFNTGNVVAVQSSELLSANFMLADGSSYRYNHAAKSWQSA